MPNVKDATTQSPPLFWRVDTGSMNGVKLTYAVRGGARQVALLLFGITLLAGGLYALYWLMAGGDLTAAGYVFLLVPAGVVLFGAYVLDTALVARTTYVLDSMLFVWSRHSLFGEKSLEIPPFHPGHHPELHAAGSLLAERRAG